MLKEPIELFNSQNEKNTKNKDNIYLINEDINEILIQYKINEIRQLKEINIFGYDFKLNNEDKCKIIIEGNEIKLWASILSIKTN